MDQDANFNSVGYITYADTGHMGVHIMPRNRPRFASNQNQPTPGGGPGGDPRLHGVPRTVHGQRESQIVTHHRIGTIRPGAPPPFLRYYEFTGDRLILTPVPANNGSREQATNRLVWERLPNAPLSAEEKKFLGFHKLLYTDSYRMKDGKEIFHGDRVEARANTSSDHLYADRPHDGPPDGQQGADRLRRRAGNARRGARRVPQLHRVLQDGARPTRTTTRRSCCTTSRARCGRAARTSATKRFYQFTGNVLRLGTPPNVNAAGETAGGHLYGRSCRRPRTENRRTLRN